MIWGCFTKLHQNIVKHTSATKQTSFLQVWFLVKTRFKGDRYDEKGKEERLYIPNLPTIQASMCCFKPLRRKSCTATDKSCDIDAIQLRILTSAMCVSQIHFQDRAERTP
jgi:hypothetical protein